MLMIFNCSMFGRRLIMTGYIFYYANMFEGTFTFHRWSLDFATRSVQLGFVVTNLSRGLVFLRDPLFFTSINFIPPHFPLPPQAFALIIHSCDGVLGLVKPALLFLHSRSISTPEMNAEVILILFDVF